MSNNIRLIAAPLLLWFAQFASASTLQEVILPSPSPDLNDGPLFFGTLEFPIEVQIPTEFDPSDPESGNCSFVSGNCQNFLFTPSAWEGFQDIDATEADFDSPVSGTGGWFVSPETGTLDFFIGWLNYDFGEVLSPSDGAADFQFLSIAFDSRELEICARTVLEPALGLECFNDPGLYESVAFAPVQSPVPLPAAAWLFGSGLLGLIGLAKRKRT